MSYPTLSEEELIDYVKDTVWAWALEEYYVNGPDVSASQRYEENFKSFVFNLMEAMEK